MRTYKKTINGLAMTAYNDSGADWVINGFRYPIRAYTLRRAFELHESIYYVGGPCEVTSTKDKLHFLREEARRFGMSFSIIPGRVDGEQAYQLVDLFTGALLGTPTTIAESFDAVRCGLTNFADYKELGL